MLDIFFEMFDFTFPIDVDIFLGKSVNHFLILVHQPEIPEPFLPFPVIPFPTLEKNVPTAFLEFSTYPLILEGKSLKGFVNLSNIGFLSSFLSSFAKTFSKNAETDSFTCSAFSPIFLGKF